MKKLLASCLVMLSLMASAQSERKTDEGRAGSFDVTQSLIEKIKKSDGVPMRVVWVLVIESASTDRWLFVTPTTYDSKELCVKAAKNFLSNGSSGSSLPRKWECGAILP